MSSQGKQGNVGAFPTRAAPSKEIGALNCLASAGTEPLGAGDAQNPTLSDQPPGSLSLKGTSPSSPRAKPCGSARPAAVGCWDLQSLKEREQPAPSPSTGS